MSGTGAQGARLLAGMVDQLNVGLFVVDRAGRLQLWNRFMELNSGRGADEVTGRELFEVFPELDEPWLRKKIETVFRIGSYAFTSAAQRPYVFRFPHHRPVTGGVDWMRQDCTFLPLRADDGTVSHVGVSVVDVTDKVIADAGRDEAMRRLGEISIRDGLTGIFNRRELERLLEAEVSRVRRYGGELSVVMFDIDHFKHVNDGHGHRAGDEVLQAVVRYTRDVLRQPDTAGRYGGEEFTLVLPETGLEGACCVAERLRESIERSPVVVGDRPIPVTISLGVSAYRDGVPDHEALLDEADQALYCAKAGGRNCVATYPQTRPDR